MEIDKQDREKYQNAVSSIAKANSGYADAEIIHAMKAITKASKTLTTTKTDIANIEKQIKEVEDLLAKATSAQQQEEYKQQKYSLEGKLAALIKKADDQRAVISNYSSRNTSNNTSDNKTFKDNTETLKYINPKEIPYNPNNVLKKEISDGDFLTFAQAIMDTINPYQQAQASQQYQAENFLSGGTVLYDVLAERAKKQGEKAYNAFLYDSDSIMPDLEELANKPELMALVEIAKQRGINSDDKMLSLIFNKLYYDQDNIMGANNYTISAENTINGIHDIMKGNFKTKNAAKIINMLSLKGQEEQLKNTLLASLY